MGLIQGDRKIDGLQRWDGTLKSLFVPPHLLSRSEKDLAQPQTTFFDDYPGLISESIDEFTYSSPQHHDTFMLESSNTDSAPALETTSLMFCLLALGIGTALLVRFHDRVRYSTLLHALKTLNNQLRTAVKPLLSQLIEQYHTTQAENRCYVELNDLLFGHNQSLIERVESLTATSPRMHSPDIEKTSQELEQKLTILEGEKEGLKAELEKKDGDLRDSGDQEKELEQKIAALEGEKEGLKAELKTKERKLKDAGDREEELEHEIAVLKGEKETLTAAVEKTNQDLKDVQTSKEQEQALEQKIAALEGEKEDLTVELETKNQELKNQQKASLDQENGLEQKMAALKSEKEGLAAELEEKQQRISDLQDENSELERSSREKDQNIADLGAQKEQLGTDLHSRDGQITSLQGQLETSTTELNDLKAEILAKAKDADEAKAAVEHAMPTAKVGNYSMTEQDLHDATYIATEASKEKSLPARPPTPQSVEKRVPVGLPSRPLFTGLPTLERNAAPQPPSIAITDSSPGSDLLPSLTRGLTRPKGTVPPLMPHHQSFRAGQSLSTGPSSSTAPAPAPSNATASFSGPSPVFGSSTGPSGSSFFGSREPSGHSLPFGLFGNEVFQLPSTNTTAFDFGSPNTPATKSAPAQQGSIFQNAQLTSGLFTGFNSSKPPTANMTATHQGSSTHNNSAASKPLINIGSSTATNPTTAPAQKGSIFQNVPLASGPFTGFGPSNPSAANIPSTNPSPLFQNTAPPPAPPPFSINPPGSTVSLPSTVDEFMNTAAEERKHKFDIPPFVPLPMPKGRLNRSKTPEDSETK